MDYWTKFITRTDTKTYYFKESDLFNYADDNTLSAFADSIHELIQTLQSGSEIAIKWLLL